MRRRNSVKKGLWKKGHYLIPTFRKKNIDNSIEENLKVGERGRI